jgi:glycosyltransferase involved in cell wall biosynthesis
LGKPEGEIAIIRSGVDKNAWQTRLKKFDRESVRASWNIPTDALVVLYCATIATLETPPGPIASVRNSRHSLDISGVFEGEGPQRSELEREVASLGIAGRVRLLGFVNDSELPGTYKAANLSFYPQSMISVLL